MCLDIIYFWCLACRERLWWDSWTISWLCAENSAIRTTLKIVVDYNVKDVCFKLTELLNTCIPQSVAFSYKWLLAVDLDLHWPQLTFSYLLADFTTLGYIVGVRISEAVYKISAVLHVHSVVTHYAKEIHGYVWYISIGIPPPICIVFRTYQSDELSPLLSF